MAYQRQPYKGFTNVDAYFDDLLARYAAFNEEHGVYLAHLNSKIESGEIEITYVDPQETMDFDRVIKAIDSPKTVEIMRSIGQGDNYAGLKYGLEVLNLSLALKKEMVEVQVQLLKEQIEISDQFIPQLKARINAAKKHLADNGSDPKIKETILIMEKELEKVLKDRTQYSFESAAWSADKLN